MKKNFLFGLFALMLAGFGFGGISIAVYEGGCDENTAIFQVGEENYYCSLSSAVTEATAGSTIKLLDDVSITYDESDVVEGEKFEVIEDKIRINKDLTLDLNGYIFTDATGNGAGDGPDEEVSDGVFIVEGATFTIKDNM